MDTKIELNEGDPFSDNTDSQNEREFFTKNVRVKTNCAAMFVEHYCDEAIKTEIKLETENPEFSSWKGRECFFNHLAKQNKSEAITYSKKYEKYIKTEIGLQKEKEFLPEDHVIKVKDNDSDHEMDKIEIKEEPWWMEQEPSAVYDNNKNAVFTPVKSPRLPEEVSSDSCGSSPLLSTEASRKNTSFSYGKGCPAYKSQGSYITTVPLVEKQVHLEHSDKCSDMVEIYNKATLSHKDKRSQKCKICDKSFNVLSDFKLHNMMHLGKKFHKCDICAKSFTKLSSLKMHNLIHEGKKPHKCDICEKSFTKLSNLKLHNMIHEGKKPHKCDICGKSFTLMSNLKMHILTHEGKKPYKCGICDKRFTQMQHLKRHSLIHDGKKPHKCEICEKWFTRLSNVKTHSLIHEGKRPHKCDICEKSFTQLSHLRSHNLTHEGKRPHKCEICDKTFTRLSHLKSHSFKHEGNKVSQV